MTPAATVAPLSERDFDRVREMAYRACGLNLHEGKRALVSSRLERVVRRRGFESFTNYLAFLSQRQNGDEFVEFIDTLTTNHSSFWREPEHFQFLRANIIAGRRTKLHVWSAACATGEEPYTIAMCAIESGFPNCRIVASDISRGALNSAMRGIYDASKLSGLPAGWAARHFQREGAAGTAMRLTDGVRALVDFKPVNLLHPFGQFGTFDVIFCRNVMIYFDRPTRDDLVERLAAQLVPGGHLFTGHSETLLRMPAGLAYVQPAIYRKC